MKNLQKLFLQKHFASFSLQDQISKGLVEFIFCVPKFVWIYRKTDVTTNETLLTLKICDVICTHYKLVH